METKAKNHNQRLNSLDQRRERLIEMNSVKRYTSNPAKADQYLNLMLATKSEIASILRLKVASMDKTNYRFAVPLNLFIKPLS